MRAEEYLAYGRASGVEHEYINAHLMALADETIAHDRLTLNMALRLTERLGNSSPYRVYARDMRILVTKGLYFYPDVVVACDIPDHTEGRVLYQPRLIVEVLSLNTEVSDRGIKFAFYQQRPSLQEYVLVNTQVQRVEVYRRQSECAWLYQCYTANQQLVLSSLNVRFPVYALYAGLRIPMEGVVGHE